MKLQVRSAQHSDAAAIARIHVAAWQAAYAGLIDAAFLAALSVGQREALWSQAIANGSPELLLAHDDDGAVAGWVALGPCRDADAPATRGEIWAIYVAPARWGQGVGRLLWQHACERMLAQGWTEASLWVLAANERASRFYAAQGFEPEPRSDRTIAVAGAPLIEVRQICPLALR